MLNFNFNSSIVRKSATSCCINSVNLSCWVFLSRILLDYRLQWLQIIFVSFVSHFICLLQWWRNYWNTVIYWLFLAKKWFNVLVVILCQLLIVKEGRMLSLYMFNIYACPWIAKRVSLINLFRKGNIRKLLGAWLSDIKRLTIWLFKVLYLDGNVILRWFLVDHNFTIVLVDVNTIGWIIILLVFISLYQSLIHPCIHQWSFAPFRLCINCYYTPLWILWFNTLFLLIIAHC